MVQATSLRGPRGLPGIGSLLSYARDTLGFLERLRSRYGDLVPFTLGGERVLLVAHPDDVEDVLVRHAPSLHKDVLYELLRPSLGNGLLTAEGEVWRRHRKLAAPSFTARHVQVYGATMVDLTQRFCAGLVPGDTIDLHDAMMTLSRDIVLRTLFGEDLTIDAAAVQDALEAVMVAFVSEVQGIHRLLPKQLPTPTRRRQRRAIAAVDRLIYDWIDQRRARGLGDDLLSRLIAARDDGGVGFDTRELRDEIITAFVAGHETTALTLTYTLQLLHEHPASAARLHEEVHDVLGGQAATAEHASRLPFTRAVVQESMRVLPPAWAVGREVVRPIQLRGLDVALGTQLVVSPWVMHRDLRWFDDPARFRPERWLEADPHPWPRMAYLPFGGGPRVCIGKHFAMLEAVLVLATLVQHVSLHPHGPLPRLVPTVTLRPSRPVPARVRRAPAPRRSGS